MNLAGKTILLLEDEPIIAFALEDMMLEQGATPLVATTLDEAGDLAATSALDCAILDVNVHGEKSYGLAEALQARKIPFVFATGYGDHGHPAHFDAVPTIAKPYDAGQVGRALATLDL